MKLLLELIRYFLFVILALSIFAIYACNLVSTTVLSEGYVISKLSQTNYYKKVYDSFNENNKKYILQSGLDENVIKDICDIKKIEQDTNYIIENIYLGRDNIIETDSIKEKLNKNIYDCIAGQEITDDSKKAIEKFVNLIAKEYLHTILSTSNLKKANNYINETNSFVKKIEKYSKFSIIASLICIFIVNLKKSYRNVSIIGMGVMLTGLLLLYSKSLIMRNIDIDYLSVFSSPFSDSLKFVAKENLGNLASNGISFILVGIILVVLGNVFENEYKKKHRKRLEAVNK